MAIKFNNTEIPNNGIIKYNGTELTKVICNGTTVWVKKANSIFEDGVFNITPKSYGDWKLNSSGRPYIEPTYDGAYWGWACSLQYFTEKAPRTMKALEVSVDVTGVSKISVLLSKFGVEASENAHAFNYTYLTCGSLSNSVNVYAVTGAKYANNTTLSLDVSSLSGVQTVKIYMYIVTNTSTAYNYTASCFTTIENILMS